MIKKIFLGFTTLCISLTLFFLFLEFIKVVDWDWWIVFSPILIYIAFLLLFWVISFLILVNEDDNYYRDDKNDKE